MSIHQTLRISSFCAMLISFGSLYSVNATRWVPEELICPLDQVPFTADVLTSRSSLISDYRLDGRPEGIGAGPWPLLVCPHNGFVFFDAHPWNSSQLEKLRAFVRSPIYQEAMTEAETYYRLARIYEYLGEPSVRIAEAYLYASWETPYDDFVLFTRKFILESPEPTDRLAAEAHYRWYVDQALSMRFIFGARLTKASAASTTR